MVKKMKKYAKFIVCMALIMGLMAPSYAALSASDGSAFVTKAEFDSALADFNSRLTTFEAGINSKVDSQVTSYLDRNGIWSGKDVDFYDGTSYTKDFAFPVGMTNSKLDNAGKASSDIVLSQTRDDWIICNKSGLMFMIVKQTASGYGASGKRDNSWRGAWNTFGWFFNFMNSTDGSMKGSIQLNGGTGNSDYTGWSSFFIGFYPQTWSILFFVKQGEQIKCVEKLSARGYDGFTPDAHYGDLSKTKISMSAKIY